MANIVVTGGAGFIGGHLTKALVGRGDTVTVFDNLATGDKKRVPPQARLVEGDIRNFDLVKATFKNADYVFHLAALPRIQKSVRYPLETNEVNIQGTLHVLEAARMAGVKRVIFASSSSVYGKQERYPLKETMKPRPLSPYALQKYMGEEYCRLYSSLYGLDTVCLRYFSVYGFGQSGKEEYATVIARFMHLRKAHKSLIIYGDGEAVRDFTHVSDVVGATIQAMEFKKQCRGDIYNICNTKGYSVNDVALKIGGKREYLAGRTGESDCIIGDNKKAKRHFFWQPMVSLEKGLALLKEV